MRTTMLGVKGIPHPGGIEHVVEQLGARLVERGHEVVVYVRPHFTPRGATRCKGIRLVHLPSIHNKYLDAITHTLLSALATARRGADVAHIHSSALSIVSPLLRSKGIPTVVQSHGLDWQRAKWGRLAKSYLRAADYAAAHLPDATTVVSRRLERYFRQQFHKPVQYIPNGVNRVRLLPPMEIANWGLGERDYLLFAARLVPEKGCHVLLDAFDRLHPRGKKLVIAGDSNYGDRYAVELKKRARDDVLFVGYVRGEPLAELMSNAYLFIQPSFIEGLSTGLLEAMSYGNCPVVSDIEENLEAIGKAGFSFRTGQAEDLACVLDTLLADDSTVAEMRVRARSHVEANYDWGSVADQYEALYRSLQGANHH